jgi:hypothetical protein
LFGPELTGLRDLENNLIIPSATASPSCLLQRGETVRVVSSAAQVQSLSSMSRWPFPQYQGSMLDPRFFLATIDANVWIPRVVVVSTPERVTGVAYFKERRIFGLRTGIVYGDSTLSGLVLADPQNRKRVLKVALEVLLKRHLVWGLRILVPPDSYELEALRETSISVAADLNHRFAENHCALPLAEEYRCFLDGLGPKTRRNFRYYRRRFDESGHRFVPQLSHQEFAAAATEFAQKSVVGSDTDGIRRALQILAVVRHPLLAGLRHRDGQWLSILGGWRESRDAIVFFQMNDDREHAASSLSVVMRGYLIEDLISDGVRVLQFWAGTGDPLRRSCVSIPASKAFLDKRGLLWSGLRASVMSITQRFPSHMKWVGDWVAWNPESLGPTSET